MDSFEINKIIGAVLAALLVIVAMREIVEISGAEHEVAEGHKLAGGFELPAPEGTSTTASPQHADASSSSSSPGTSPTQPATTTSTAATPAASNSGAAAPASITALLARADVKAGQKVFKKCKACHSTAKGGPNKVGPNLWGIVGRDRASAPGFKYSSAMAAKGGKWTYQDLAAFLAKPKAFVKGTKMSFSGLKKEKDLANIIAYLRSLSDNPLPLPQ